MKQVKYLPEQLSRVHDKLSKKIFVNKLKAVTHVEEGNTFHKNERGYKNSTNIIELKGGSTRRINPLHLRPC